MNKLFALACAAMAATVSMSAAEAAKVYFNLTGQRTASFSLDQSPVPSSLNNSSYFRVLGVSGYFSSGFGATFTKADLDFYETGQGGGFGFQQPGDIVSYGVRSAQLFSGTTNSPTFVLGRYDVTVEQGGPVVGSLLISATPVPEPASWAMMLAGFGMVGVTLRRRRTTSAATCA